MLLAKMPVSKGKSTLFTGECCFFIREWIVCFRKDDSIMHFTFAISDFCDMHKSDSKEEICVFSPVFKGFSGIKKFAGIVSTGKCSEDNTLGGFKTQAQHLV
jgi:hypothetical protein